MRQRLAGTRFSCHGAEIKVDGAFTPAPSFPTLSYLLQRALGT